MKDIDKTETQTELKSGLILGADERRENIVKVSLDVFLLLLHPLKVGRRKTVPIFLKQSVRMNY